MGEKAVKKQGLASKLIGDKKFYKMILLIAVPIMIQNGITNFVSLLDNIMIGRIGTEQMSGAAIVKVPPRCPHSLHFSVIVLPEAS